MTINLKICLNRHGTLFLVSAGLILQETDPILSLHVTDSVTESGRDTISTARILTKFNSGMDLDDIEFLSNCLICFKMTVHCQYPLWIFKSVVEKVIQPVYLHF